MAPALSSRNRNELSLLAYSLKMLSGPGLVAVIMITAFLVIVIFTSSLDTHGSRLATLLFSLETFAPLLGIVIFSGLLGADLGSGYLDNLQTSGEGIARVVLRKTLHGALFTAAVCLILLCVLRLVYTPFNVLWALGIVVPATWYFGMIGLVAATATRKTLAGFTTGTALLLMAIAGQQVSPLLLQSYSSRRNLVNLRLLEDGNWLIAKVYFAVISLVLAMLVVRMIRGRRAGIRGCIVAVAMIATISSGLHWLWARPVTLAAGTENEVIDTRDTADVRRVRIATSTVQQELNRRVEGTLIREERYTRAGDQWVFDSASMFHPSSEIDLLHIDMTCALDVDLAELDISARLRMRAIDGPLDRVFLYLGSEMHLDSLSMGGERVEYRRRMNLVDILLPESIRNGEIIELEVAYRGPVSDIAEGVARDFIALFDDWYPATRDPTQNWVDPFTCRFDLHLPKPWTLAGAEAIDHDAAGAVFLWESPIPIHRVPLCAGVFQEYKALYGDIPVSVHAFTFDEAYARRLLASCADILSAHEAAFGPYPHPKLAFVEDRFLNASGTAHPGMMTIRSDRAAKDNEASMVELLLPHEIAHQWWRLGLPKWLAEGGAVYANYRYIDQRQGPQAALSFLDETVYQPYIDSQSVMEPLVTDYGNVRSMYARGAYLLVAVESRVGVDALLDVLRAFLDRHRHESRIDEEALNRDLEQALHALLGESLHPFISDWMRSPKRFDPSVVRLENAASGTGYDIAVHLEHKGEIQFPTRVRLGFIDGSVVDLDWPAGEIRSVLRHASVQPATSVEIDPENRLLDWNRQNNRAEPTIASRTPEADPASSIARWESYTTQDGLGGPVARALLYGRDGRLYAGSGYPGTLSGSTWHLSTFDGQWHPLVPDPELGVTILAMAQSRTGAMWIGGNRSLWRVEEDQATQWILKEQRFGRVGAAKFAPQPDANSTIPGSHVYALLVDRDDSLWVGTDHGASLHIPGDGTWRHFSTGEGLGGQAVMALAEDHEGVIWAGTSRGVYSYAENRWSAHQEIARDDLVLAIAVDADGTLWFGTYRNGLVAWANGDRRQYTSSNSGLIHDWVSSLALDPDGRLWFGGGAGLGCFDGESWKQFDQANSGLPSSRIHRLEMDDSGHLWIGTDVGVTRYEL